MSEEVDQITKVPSELEAEVPKKKEKDPKKVAAGKVAAYSKKMREAYDREKKAGAEAKNRASSFGGLSMQNIAIGVLVVSLTAYNLYLRYSENNVRKYIPPPPPPNTPEPTSRISIKTPKIGME